MMKNIILILIFIPYILAMGQEGPSSLDSLLNDRNKVYLTSEAKQLFEEEYLALQASGMKGVEVDLYLGKLGNYLKQNFGYHLDPVTISLNKEKNQAEVLVQNNNSQKQIDELKDFYLKLHRYRIMDKELKKSKCSNALYVDLNGFGKDLPDMKDCAKSLDPILNKDTRDLILFTDQSLQYLSDETPVQRNPMRSLLSTNKWKDEVEHSGNKYLRSINECHKRKDIKVCSRSRDMKSIHKKAYNLNKMQHLLKDLFFARQKKLMARIIGNNRLIDPKMTNKELSENIAKDICPKHNANSYSWSEDQRMFGKATSSCLKKMTTYGSTLIKEKGYQKNKSSVEKIREDVNHSIKNINKKLKKINSKVPVEVVNIHEVKMKNKSECTVQYIVDSNLASFKETLFEYNNVFINEGLENNKIKQFLSPKPHFLATDDKTYYKRKVPCQNKRQLQAKLNRGPQFLAFPSIPKVKSQKEMKNLIDIDTFNYKMQAKKNAEMYNKTLLENSRPAFTQTNGKNEIALLDKDVRMISNRFHKFLNQDPELVKEIMTSNPAYLRQLCSLVDNINNSVAEIKENEENFNRVGFIAGIASSLFVPRIGTAGTVANKVASSAKGLGQRVRGLGGLKNKIIATTKNNFNKFKQEVSKEGISRLLIKDAPHIVSRNPIKNFSGYLNHPIETIFKTKKQLTFIPSIPVSTAFWTPIFNMPVEFADQYLLNRRLEFGKKWKKLVIGGNYAWGLHDAKLVDSDKFNDLLVSHREEFNRWKKANGKGVQLERLKRLQKVMSLSFDEVEHLNELAWKTYQEQVVKINEEGLEKNSDNLQLLYHNTISSLIEKIRLSPAFSKLSVQEKNLLATVFYPVVPIKDTSEDDVSYLYKIIKGKETHTQKINEFLQEGLPLPEAIRMLQVLEMNNSDSSKKALSIDQRPDFAITANIIEFRHKANSETFSVKGERGRWDLLASDHRFAYGYERYTKGDLGEYETMKYVNDVINSYNEVYELAQKKRHSGLDTGSVNQALSNPLFTALNETLINTSESQGWSKEILQTKQKQAVSIWLSYLEKNATNKDEDIAVYQQKFLKLLNEE